MDYTILKYLKAVIILILIITSVKTVKAGTILIDGEVPVLATMSSSLRPSASTYASLTGLSQSDFDTANWYLNVTSETYPATFEFAYISRYPLCTQNKEYMNSTYARHLYDAVVNGTGIGFASYANGTNCYWGYNKNQTPYTRVKSNNFGQTWSTGGGNQVSDFGCNASHKAYFRMSNNAYQGNTTSQTPTGNCWSGTFATGDLMYTTTYSPHPSGFGYNIATQSADLAKGIIKFDIEVDTGQGTATEAGSFCKTEVVRRDQPISGTTYGPMYHIATIWWREGVADTVNLGEGVYNGEDWFTTAGDSTGIAKNIEAPYIDGVNSQLAYESFCYDANGVLFKTDHPEFYQGEEFSNWQNLQESLQGQMYSDCTTLDVICKLKNLFLELFLPGIKSEQELTSVKAMIEAKAPFAYAVAFLNTDWEAVGGSDAVPTFNFTFENLNVNYTWEASQDIVDNFATVRAVLNVILWLIFLGYVWRYVSRIMVSD